MPQFTQNIHGIQTCPGPDGEEQFFLEHHWSVQPGIGKMRPLRVRSPMTKDHVVIRSGNISPTGHIGSISSQNSPMRGVAETSYSATELGKI